MHVGYSGFGSVGDGGCTLSHVVGFAFSYPSSSLDFEGFGVLRCSTAQNVELVVGNKVGLNWTPYEACGINHKDTCKDNKGCTMAMGYMIVVLHMMWI